MMNTSNSAVNDASGFSLRLVRAPRSFESGRTQSRPTSNKKKRRPPPGIDAFDLMIEQAEYEVRHDPYRGLVSSTISPWQVCAMGGVAAANIVVQDSSPADLVAASVCQCPTVQRWYAQAQVQKNQSGGKKRQRMISSNSYFVGRPEEEDIRCACDYNPFCLATLGGAMNQALTERMQDLNSNSRDNNSMSRNELNGRTNGRHCSDDDAVVVVDAEGERRNGLSGEEERSRYFGYPDSSDSIYSAVTAKRLKRLRRHKTVQVEPMRSYLKSILGDTTSVISLDECMLFLRKWHTSLTFINPLDEETESSSTDVHMRLSIPPGIENLGATCYLNTQLQCLAQNRVFVEGIFAWGAPANKSEDRMTKVIRVFQHLLAGMNAGPAAVINTLEFSNALGLDNFEQQDPNEFSRLFFDRLHESFQQSSVDRGGSGFDLTGLLPHLFQGITMYETTCLICKTASRRNEEFMDLNLPIVSPASGRQKGQQSVLEIFATKWDVDVQQCFDAYVSAETLEGDNQYFCSECDCKSDATRKISFEKLPPVLNIQLSRYVYDRRTNMKKKLEDNVLLPLELKVNAKGKVREAATVEHRYVLTAVMRHQGKSAYSGHYVAEAMDWLTGRWFEFNDEKVSSLESGPSCSFDPPKRNRKGTPPAGSKDAYNMYYVEESFLAQSALDSLREHMKSPGNCALETIEIERSACYSDVAQ
jgi:ubiquitin C-terminal hydrolase